MFLLGGSLKTPESALSIVRTSQLSWQQLADNNVIFVGVQNLFFNQLRNMPIAPQLVPELNGVRDEHPRNGRPSFYADEYTTAPSEQGTIYALVTHLPGPNGKNDIESFTSNRSAGYLGAVQSFTDPQFARMLAIKLKEETGGKVPRFYQVLFQVHYRDGVPDRDEVCPRPRNALRVFPHSFCRIIGQRSQKLSYREAVDLFSKVPRLYSRRSSLYQ